MCLSASTPKRLKPLVSAWRVHCWRHVRHVVRHMFVLLSEWSDAPVGFAQLSNYAHCCCCNYTVLVIKVAPASPKLVTVVCYCCLIYCFPENTAPISSHNDGFSFICVCVWVWDWEANESQKFTVTWTSGGDLNRKLGARVMPANEAGCILLLFTYFATVLSAWQVKSARMETKGNSKTKNSRWVRELGGETTTNVT